MNLAASCVLAFALAAASNLSPAASDGEWTTDERGQLLLATFKNAPYPHPSRVTGHKRGEQTFPAAEHYSDSTVAVFIPTGWRDDGPPDLVYYFHGWGNNVRQSIDEARLREQIIEGGKNVVLVFPQGPRNASDSGCGKLEDPDGLKELTTEVINRLRADGKTTATAPGRIVLSGHSGAYLVIGKALQHGGLEDHITDVYLLDASYGQLDQFAAWVQRHPTGYLRSIFTEHLAPENVELMAMLDDARVAYRLTTDGSTAGEAALAAPRTFVYTTKRDHNACRELLGPWLAASSLDPLAPVPPAATPAP